VSSASGLVRAPGAAPRKGDVTRQTILQAATSLATRVGLEGVTIGGLAEELGLSKSGLFAHFRSKEALQEQVLQFAAQRFIAFVAGSAITAPRGEPRVRALFERWLEWARSGATAGRGGCLFVAASTELDDQPGPVRERLVRLQKDWLAFMAGAYRLAVAQGHFGPGDAEQFAHDVYGTMLAYHHADRLLGDPAAERRARTAFEALVQAARTGAAGGRRQGAPRKRQTGGTRRAGSRVPRG